MFHVKHTEALLVPQLQKHSNARYNSQLQFYGLHNAVEQI